MVHVKHRTVLLRIRFRGTAARAAEKRTSIEKHAFIQSVKHRAGLMLGEIGQARHASALSISYINSETGFVVLTTKRGFEAELVKILENIKEFAQSPTNHQASQQRTEQKKQSPSALRVVIEVESVHGTIKQAMRKITKISRNDVRLRMRRSKTVSQVHACLKAYKSQ